MITCDPGVNGSGFASWGKDGVLQTVWYDVPANQDIYTDHLVIELPQIYLASRSKGNPNDLIRLAFEAGRIAGLFNTHETISPRSWKGTIKKEVMLRRIVSRLTDAELTMLKALKLPPSKEKEVIDAIGIGLHMLKRL